MDVKVVAVLEYEGEPAGIRFSHKNDVYDIDMDSLQGVMPLHLHNYPVQKLRPYKNLLVTREEVEQRIIIKEITDPTLASKVTYILLNPPTPKRERLEPEAKPQVKTQTKAQAKTKQPDQKGNKIFDVVVEVKNYNPIDREFQTQQFHGEFPAKSALLARKIAKEVYAVDFDTTPEEITIISAKLKA